MTKSKRGKKPRRVVLGVGHPWFESRRRFDGTQVRNGSVALFTKDMGGDPIRLAIGDLGGYSHVRLIAEIL